MNEIIEHYKQMITLELTSRNPGIVIKIKPMLKDPLNDIHLLWMLSEISFNEEQSETKKHRWLGFVQAIVISKNYTTIKDERDFTRDLLNGK